MNITNQKPNAQQVPSLEKLSIMLMNGTDFVPMVQDMIDKFKLPYLIVEVEGWTDDTRRWKVKNKLTEGEQWLSKFISVDTDTVQMKKYSSLMAPTPHSVLICGETGTGKELIAKSMIHNRTGPIKAVNCAGLPEYLIESELFGHLKGAFTGAENTKEGMISAATDGVMFLDEIGELPLPMQSKLLRVLQEKTIRKVGSNKEESINCKFVFATNRDLRKMTEEGTFKKDLFARISTLELFIKPLRERQDDLVPITESLEGGKEFLVKYKEPLLLGALDLSWNVRSLEQHVIRFNVLGSVLLKQ